MSYEKAKEYLTKLGYKDRIKDFNTSSATVELASVAVGCEPKQIAKSLTFEVNGQPIMIVTAGDAKVDNAKFKAYFYTKATMLSHDDVSIKIGHAVGGVCPFAINEGVKVFLDISLKRFTTVYPACGSDNSAVALSVKELEQTSNYTDWVDVCKNWEY